MLDYRTWGKTRNNHKSRLIDVLRELLLLSLVLSLVLFFLGILAAITWGSIGDL